MQSPKTKTSVCEHNNILYAIDSEFSDWFGDDSSSLSLHVDDVRDDVPPSPPTTRPGPRIPIRVQSLIKSPKSPGRNIDMMMIKKAKISKFDNRRTLLQRFQSISRRRKMETSNHDKQPLRAVSLPVESTVSKKPRASTPWETYSKQNYFRGVFAGKEEEK